MMHLLTSLHPSTQVSLLFCMCYCLQEHRLQTAEQAEAFYKKREKKAAPAGWEAFNNKTLFKAYERRAENLPVDMEVGPST